LASIVLETKEGKAEIRRPFKKTKPEEEENSQDAITKQDFRFGQSRPNAIDKQEDENGSEAHDNDQQDDDEREDALVFVAFTPN
jgi:hypothetical protein